MAMLDSKRLLLISCVNTSKRPITIGNQIRILNIGIINHLKCKLLLKKN